MDPPHSSRGTGNADGLASDHGSTSYDQQLKYMQQLQLQQDQRLYQEQLQQYRQGYTTTAPVFWSYHYDRDPEGRQLGKSNLSGQSGAAVAATSPRELQQPHQLDVKSAQQKALNEILAQSLYDSIRENYSYILQTQYNYGVDSDGNIWGAHSLYPMPTQRTPPK